MKIAYIEYEGELLEVEYYYTPYEPPSSTDPGEPEQLEICSAKTEDGKFLSQEELLYLEEALMEQRK